MSVDEWVKKMWCLHPMGYCSAIKRNEIMPFAVTQIDLEIILLSKKGNQKYHMMSHMWYKISKI